MTPPHSLDAEQAVLGAILYDGRSIDAVLETGLTPDAFYLPSHNKIFEAMVAVDAENRPIDSLTILGELDRWGKAEEYGDRVHELAGIGISYANPVHHAKILRSLWVKRELVNAGDDIRLLGIEGQGDMSDIISKADARILAVSSLYSSGKNDRVFTGAQVVEEFRQRLATPEVDEGGIAVPFSFLAELRPSRLYVLAGYQKDGKTMGCTQFLRAAAEAGARVGFASVEMSREDMIERLAATFGVPYTQIRDRKIESAYQPTLESALKTIESWDWEIIDDEDMDAGSLRRHQRRGKYDLLIIDHLHELKLTDRKHQREELEEQVKAIKRISREFKIPVLLLAQLSRTGAYNDPYPRPNAKMLKGTGAIEQVASHIWFLYRHRDEHGHRLNTADFIITDSRYSQEGSVELQLQPRYMRFVEN